MCGRTSLFATPETLAARFGVDVTDEYEPRYNVAPETPIAAIRDDAPDALEHRHWGFVPTWADDADEWNGLINARTESVDEKPAFREAYDRQRCLVVADGFYEWQERTDGTQPFRVERADGEPFAMAGVWSRWEGPDRTVESAAILTTEANDLMEPLHHRMPVIFDAEDERDWLRDEPPAKDDLLEPHSGDGFEKYPISTAVNDPSNDVPEIVEPVDAPESDPQSGLDEFV
ncbi:Putative SOS response-associated peptidase YedK [Natronoarchaeum philippinense]|uniref:Putative SOS response-associated peptidase YedK n=1 Tax=Natronoarchaeum philippinense TaxID=558529 RepID=A0A285NSB4_NATPI|nr:SOS response-associated peptidase [Natronoarchaeum philippinense]SNZ12400.1 Putative SOS response-associated peptidase YedK [Natronoarchaeum philippinense]